MKKFVVTMAAAAVVVLFAIFLKNEYGSVFSGEVRGIPAVLEREEVDYLFIGSSMFRMGLDIDVLEEKLDGSVYVLSYNGNQPTFIAQELEYLLEQGLKINHLYIDFYTFSAIADPWIFDEKIFLDTDIKFKLEAWNKLDAYNHIGWLTFYEMFVTANNELIFTYPIYKKAEEPVYRNGGYLEFVEGKTTEELQEMERNPLGTVHEIQAEGYRQIFELAEEHDIPLLFLETPKYEKIREERGEECYFTTLEEMKNLADEIGITYVLSDEVGFDYEDAECFNDLIHLSSKGRSVYSENLCEYLLTLE